MYNFKTLRCCKCKSVMFNLPEKEVQKLNGSQFRCECCGHMNRVAGFNFVGTAVNSLSYTAIRNEKSNAVSNWL